MLFNLLSSEVIKAGLVSKLQFSLGFKLIAAQIKAKQPFQINQMDTDGETDYSPLEKAEEAKRAWCSFQDFCQTHSYSVSSLEDIATAYIKSTGKPIVKTTPEVLALRAKVTGVSIESLSKNADSAMLKAQANIAEKVNKIVAEFGDIKLYANAWMYDDNSTEIENIILNDWVIENYPKVLKSQLAFWQRYNNWDDAELVCIAADQELIK